MTLLASRPGREHTLFLSHNICDHLLRVPWGLMQASLLTWLVPGLKGWGLPWIPALSSLFLSSCLHTAASGWLTSCMWAPGHVSLALTTTLCSQFPPGCLTLQLQQDQGQD